MRWGSLPVRPGERRNAFGAFLLLFGILAAHSLLETARDALFLASIPVGRLPIVYLAIAALALVVTNARGRAARHTRGRWELSLWLATSALVTVAFWRLVGSGAVWTLYTIYVWSGFLSTFLVVRFWLLADELFTVTQAKRIFAFVGSGSILGAIAGSALAQNLVSRMDVTVLLPAAAAVLAGTALAPLLLVPPPAEATARKRHSVEEEPESLRDVARGIWNHAYLKRVAGIVLASTITLTLVDFVFKGVMAREFPNSLAYVFATTYLILNVFSLIVQVLFVGWVTRRLSIERVMGAFPALLFGAVVWLLAGGATLAAFLLKAIDGTFRHSLHRTASEVLYVPLTRAWRERAKSFIDVIGARGGQAIASVLFLIAAALGATDEVFGGMLLAFCGAWLVLAIGLRRHYFDLFRKTLDEGIIQTKIEFPELDLASLETLMEALSSSDDSEVLAALDLLAEKGRTRLVPTPILYHPSTAVVVRALEHFEQAGRTDHLPTVERLLDHDDDAVRVAALVALPPGDRDRERLESALTDSSADVRATALVGLASGSDRPHPRVQSILETLVLAGSTESKQALARAIRRRPDPRFDDDLVSLAGHPDASVACEVARAMRAPAKEKYLPSLIRMLPMRGAREEARESIAAIGPPALAFLSNALHDESLPEEIRRHVPRSFRPPCDPEEASRILLSRLPEEPDGVVRFKILRALGSICSRHPEVKLDQKILEETIDRSLEVIFRLLDWRTSLKQDAESHPERATAVRDMIVRLLAHKERHALERTFRLLSLRYPKEDFRRIYRGTTGGGREALASSRELIEHVVGSPEREALLGFFDEVPDRERLRAGRVYYRAGERSHAELLRTLLGEGGLHLRCLVAYHVAELGLRELTDDLRRLGEEALGELESSFEHALEMLESPGEEAARFAPLR